MIVSTRTGLRIGAKTHSELVLRQGRIIPSKLVKEWAALFGAGVFKASLEYTASIRVGGQIKHRATEGPHKCHSLANDTLQHLLYDVVAVGVAHAAQNMAVELTHERSLLIREETLDSLKERMPRSASVTCNLSK